MNLLLGNRQYTSHTVCLVLRKLAVCLLPLPAGGMLRRRQRCNAKARARRACQRLGKLAKLATRNSQLRKVTG